MRTGSSARSYLQRPARTGCCRRSNLYIMRAIAGKKFGKADRGDRIMLVLQRIALLAITCLLCATAQAQDYPSKPVTFVVPYAPGGVTDLFARMIAQRLEQRLGKPFVVENRPGGSAV